ncbi:hypothetical protein HK15_09910 [Acetobacter orientalis]|uniref:Uroporphyrinogen-III synthase n=1 Tax=Acetobacter orientalis TaxID=146474 RepID=A0A252BGX3_9PROT|nr:uroporphyrinogen-III synthase [Acetobacter orientalis]OUJ03709.1 hypothetical protein HK15_09910 [Acetobacter orientalis]
MSQLLHPHKSIGVLVTRPEPGLSETLVAVQKAGWQAYASPALEISAHILPPLAKPPTALVLTSSQAIACACAMVAKNLPVFAVGARTAQRAQAAGFTQVYSANGNAADLQALLARMVVPEQERLLLLSGAGQGVSLATQLQALGFTVTRQVAYAARPVAQIEPAIVQQLRAGSIGYSLFFSAQSAKAWVQALPRDVLPFAAQTTALVLSGATADIVRAAGWQQVHVAVQPNATALLALLGTSPA